MSNTTLTFANTILKAEVVALLGIVEELWAHTGYKDPDGLTAVERFYKQRVVELDTLFRDLEDASPDIAAAVHEQYERARKALGPDKS